MGSSSGELRRVGNRSSGRYSLCDPADGLKMMSGRVGHDDRGCFLNENVQEIS